MQEASNKIAFLGPELVEEILKFSTIQEIPKGTEILKEEQYIKVLPLVLTGLVKVYSRFDDRELLLYYIQQKESCVMSFSASINHEPSKVFAVTEEDSTILLLPAEKLPEWLIKYPKLNNLFYQQYNLRYTEMLETIRHVLIDKMDKRLHDYLVEKSRLTGKSKLKISHQQIANDLGTVREVVSRIMKKLEGENLVSQKSDGIKVLSSD
jgi:CRP/FNR family transcriptional regulator|tara:strand:- start:645 stop:1271 length:627 start_codon:yes stop_codon:yes gene_type:complete